MFAVLQAFSGLMAAWNQVLALFTGGVIATLGLLLLGNRLYWRLWGTHVLGVIAGVRADDNRLYHEVYRYRMADGSTHEATSDIGTRANESMRTGREVPLLVLRRHPDAATPLHHYIMEVVGSALALVGALVLRLALRAWPITSSTWIALGLLALSAATHLYRRLHPKGGTQPPAPPLSRLRHEDWHQAPMQPVEELLDAQQIAAQRAQWQRSTRYLRLALPLIGVAVIGVGLSVSSKLWSLQTQGLSADGRIVSLERSRTGNNSSYYPIVGFVSRDGEAVRFRDNLGSNPSPYAPGQHVRVRYLAASPAHSAIIDHGLWNWLLPAGLALSGVGLFAVTIVIARKGQAPASS